MLQRALLRHGLALSKHVNARNVFQASSLRATRRKVTRGPQRGITRDQPQSRVEVSQLSTGTIEDIKSGDDKARRGVEVDPESLNSFEDFGLTTKKYLEKAYKDGALQIHPERIGVFLEQLSGYGEVLTATVLRKTCSELSIPVDAAYSLARILVRSPGQYDRHVGRQILLQASQLGSAKATLHIVKGATKSDQLDKNEVQPALAHVRRLASRDPPVIPALVAQAKILELEQDFEEAAQLYRKAIEHVPPTETTLTSRLVQSLVERYGATEDEAKIEPKITVENKDQELDVVAAHLGLAHLQYHHLGDEKSAVVNWEIAAFEYDDPLAYFKLTEYIRDVVKIELAGDASEQHRLHWMLSVPYKWYEYTMKAAVSGHAIACLQMGDFYSLELIGLSDRIKDAKLRRTLKESPLVHATPKTLFFGNVPSALANQVDTVLRWYNCAGKAGLNEGYLAAATVERIVVYTDINSRLRRSLLDDVAFDGKTETEGLQDVQWSSNDRELAKRLLEANDQVRRSP